MRRTISKKDKGRNRIADIGLVLVFALLLSLFTAGLLAPVPALATTPITDCGGCHIYNGTGPMTATSTTVQDGTSRNVPAGLFPGSHGIHAGTGNTPGNLQYGFACTKCHVSNTTNNHRNGYIDMAQPINGDTGGAYSRGTVSFPVSNTSTPGTCIQIYCHSNGTGGTLNAGDTRAIGWTTSPTWGGAATCSTCHGVGGDGSGQPWYTNGSPKANSHPSHLPWNTTVSCYVCHSATVSNTSTAISNTSNHDNRIYNLAPVGAPTFTDASFTYTYGTSGGTCASNTCHAGQSPQWGNPGSSPTGDWDCIGCHSYSFPKKLGSLGTIRQVVGTGGDFNMSRPWNSLVAAGATRHLFGATTIVKWDCIICHREGQAAAGTTQGNVDWTMHYTNGLVNLRNVDTINTGWAINNKAWATTDYDNLDQFCVTCHDANGASGINVNATNNGLNLANTRALTPFNTTDVVGGYLKGSTWYTGSERIRVTDVKDQFFAGTTIAGPNYNGNPSQHAVFGQRYSTINARWGTGNGLAWSSYVLKRRGVNVNVSRETSLLSCADCHVLDSGSGAHGGAYRYNLWTTTQSAFCWRCHASNVYNMNATATGIARLDHQQITGGGHTGSYSAYGFPNDPQTACLLCHAGWVGTSTVSRQNSYGGIHGSWVTYTGWGSTPGVIGYRFFPGTWNIQNTRVAGNGGWSTNYGGASGNTNCYFQSSANRFSNCSSHSSGASNSNTWNYARPTQY